MGAKKGDSKMKKTGTLLVAALAGSLVLAGCQTKAASHYTSRGWATSLADDWNPHSWETNADSSMLDYLTEPLIGTAPLDTEKLSWQWTYRAAKSVTDVTEDHVEDLDKFGVEYTEKSLAEGGYVFEIKINKEVRFEEKEVTVGGKTKKYGGYTVKASDYVESAKLMLDSSRRNYRANNYYSSDSAIAGALKFYNSDYEGWLTSRDVYGTTYSSEYDTNMYFYGSLDNEDGKSYLIDYVASLGYGADYLDAYGFGNFLSLLFKGFPFAGDEADAVFAALDGKTYAQIKADATLNGYFTALLNWWKTESYEDLDFFYSRGKYAHYDWDANEEAGTPGVGLYAVDDETLIYVLAGQSDIDNFKTSLTSNWLVETQLYKDLSKTDETTGLVVTTYGSDANTSISYGPYRLVSFEAAKQMKFDQNPQWWGWTSSNGDVHYSTSEKLGYKVNGAYQPIYQTTGVVVDVMEQGTAKQKFEKGELNDYTPTASELINEYSLSSQLYQVDETYTMRFFLDTNLTDLKEMDRVGTNANGVVLSNYNFRKAFSLAIDRADWVTKTEGYKPAYSLINNLYYYDVFNDPESIYRNTPQAMKAIVDLYGVEYGEGKQYATLEAAYKSITGYNLDEAKALMKQACDEVSKSEAEGGLGYVKGQKIKFSVAYKKGALDATDRTQVKAIENYLNAAVAGSGFGEIELEAVGSLDDRYGAVGTEGTYAIGYGAWGGAAFYPFTMFRVYCDPDYADLHSGRCWNPKNETLTLTVGGEEVTMTWQKWANYNATGGAYVGADNETKLEILAQLEYNYYGKLYDIPLATSTQCFLLGYQQHYFTEEYNIMYGFGGLELMVYDYDDVAWDNYVKSQGGTLIYR